jgi:hypothetical protein
MIVMVTLVLALMFMVIFENDDGMSCAGNKAHGGEDSDHAPNTMMATILCWRQ